MPSATRTSGRPMRNSASRFKGVSFDRSNTRWRALYYIAKGKPLTIGYFDTEEEAARAYDETALRFRGPSAFLNFRDLQRKTEPIVTGACTRVPLNTGEYFLIDTADLGRVGQFYWHRSLGHITGTRGSRLVCLHTLLLGPLPRTHIVVHLNGDQMDCRNQNLAVAPRFLHFAGHHPGYGSRYKGVRRRSDDVWEAVIGVHHLGRFASEIDAALVYDEAARSRYGRLAALNFPGKGELSCLPPCTGGPEPLPKTSSE